MLRKKPEVGFKLFTCKYSIFFSREAPPSLWLFSGFRFSARRCQWFNGGLRRVSEREKTLSLLVEVGDPRIMDVFSTAAISQSPTEQKLDWKEIEEESDQGNAIFFQIVQLFPVKTAWTFFFVYFLRIFFG